MSQAIPLPEDTTGATEGAMDKSKPHALPQPTQHRQGRHDKPRQDPQRTSREGEEHPLSVGQP